VFELDVLETDEREDRDGEVVSPRPVDCWYDDVEVWAKYEEVDCCRATMADLGLAGGDSMLLVLYVEKLTAGAS
jgi:hypothetical protein